MKVRRLNAFLCLFFFISVCCADESKLSAQQWLEKLSEAMKETNYQGTVAFSKNGRLDTMKFLHAFDNDSEQERLLSLNSPMREVTRVNGRVQCLFVDTQEMIVNHHPVKSSFLVDLPENLDRLAGIYEFQLQDQASVAMRKAQVVAINALDDLRYSRKIWIDELSFLPLKIEVYDLDNQIIEQTVFTDLQIDHHTPAWFQEASQSSPDEKITIKHIHKMEPVPNDAAVFNEVNLPAGFRKVGYTRMEKDDSRGQIDHLSLSDGFSTVSVYREEITLDSETGLKNLGSVNSYTQLSGNYQYTAMGEVPVKTVRLIAENIQSR